MKIEEIRKIIDGLDEEIIKLLSDRARLMRDVSTIKKLSKIPLTDAKRESKVFKKIRRKASELGLKPDFAESLFKEIIENSKKEQQSIAKHKKNIEIGIIGFGRFGSLIAKHLSHEFRIFVFDKVNKNRLITEENAIPASLKDVCKKDIVVLAVPISELENVLEEIKQLLRQNTLVIDVCSVKEHPVALMKKILPNNIQILATHPLFGPDTATYSLNGRKIALCKVRIKDELHNHVKDFLKSKGLVVIETTPEEHDKQIAKSLLLTHFIGRALVELNESNIDIDTKGYKNLMEVLETVKHDTWRLFEDMNHYNKYANEVRKNFIKSAIKIDKRLK